MIPDRPLPQQNRVLCSCGCGAFGAPNKRNGHVKRKCNCRKCIGGRNRRRGLAKQRDARRKLGIPDAKYASKLSDEENWNGAVRAEVKSGRIVGPIATRYLAAEKQSEASRAVGDARPFVFIAMPEGFGSEGLVVMRLSAWREHVAPRLEDS